MARCFIYARQSVSDNEDFSESVESQVEKLKEKAKALGLEVTGIFKDLDASGKTYETGAEDIAKLDMVFAEWCRTTSRLKKFRKGFGELIKRIREVDVVLCWDLTRLYRPLTGSFLESHINQVFTTSKVKLICLEGGAVDFSNFNDALITTIQNRINDNQIKIQVEKSQAVIKRMRDSGEWNFACAKAFGYRGTGRRREVEIDPVKAEVVRKVFQLYIEGKSYYMIGRAVNQVLYETTGKTLFKTHMCRMIQNPVYCGYTRASDGSLVKAKPLEGKTIIDFATWKKAQEIYHSRKIYPKREKKHWLPLSGKVICGICGEGMRATTSNKTDVQYRCFSYSKHGYDRSHSCGNGHTWSSSRKLDGGDFIVDALMGLLSAWFVDKLEQVEMDSSRDAEMQEVEVSILSIKKKQQTLTESFLDGQIDEALYKGSLEMLKKKLKEAELKLDELKNVQTAEGYDAVKLLFDLEALNSGEVDDSVLYQAMRETFKKVLVWPDHIEAVTMKGSVELPIKKIGQKHAHLLPYHFIAAGKNGEADVIYHWRDEAPEDYEEVGRKIADFGKVKVWIVE